MMSVAAVDMCLLGKLVMNLLQLLLTLCIHVQYVTLCFAFALEKAIKNKELSWSVCRFIMHFCYTGYPVRLDILDPRETFGTIPALCEKKKPSTFVEALR